MAKWHGRHTFVAIQDSTSQFRNISGDVSSIEAPSDQDIVDVSGFSDSKKNYVTGLADTRVTLKGQFSDAGTAISPAASGAYATLVGLVQATAGYVLRFGPKGSASGYPLFSGTYLLNKFNINSAINGAVMYDAELVPFSQFGGVWGTFA